MLFVMAFGKNVVGWHSLGLLLALALNVGCKKQKADTSSKQMLTHVSKRSAASRNLSIVGTSDLHGSLGSLPHFAGYLNNLREVKDAVLLVDAGDMFQGTLESNSVEGKSVVEAYNLLGYDAVAIGNHEFDFGPVGPRFVAELGGDARGALKARAREATFPFLASNMMTDKGVLSFTNSAPSIIKEMAGIKIGIVGASTMGTLTTTLASNVEDLRMIPIAEAINSEAKSLRTKGAELVVAIVHAGGECKTFNDSRDLSSCRLGELGDVVEKLDEGSVDVIVAGHTHKAISHEVLGVSVIQSYANGRAFGRVDIELATDGAIKKSMFPPQNICSDSKDCADYEGNKVRADAGLKILVDKAKTEIEPLELKKLGIELKDKFRRGFKEESPLGNLFADLMLKLRPQADVAITNGGGIRADLPKGSLRYGQLYRAHPFDNQFAFVDLDVSSLQKIIKNNLKTSFGYLSVSGVQIKSTCETSVLKVTVFKNGKSLKGDSKIKVVTSDYLASGMFTRAGIAKNAIAYERGQYMRDAMADGLAKIGGAIGSNDYFIKSKPRHRYPGKRPVKCD